jgi:RNA polymerase sigma-70 factor, ECF subfamily
VTCPPSSMNFGSDIGAGQPESQRIFSGQPNSRRFPSESTLFRPHKSAGTRSKGNEFDALQELLQASRKRYVRVAFGILHHKEDAEDAVQDAFLLAYRHYRGFEGRSALTTWLTRIVMNAALMLRRKRKNPTHSPSEFHPDTAPSAELIPAPQPDPESAYAIDETNQILRNALELMTPVLRQAFTLRYCDQLSANDACALLGVKVGTYKSRLFRAKQHLLSQVQIHRLAPVRPPAQSPFSIGGHRDQSAPEMTCKTRSHEMVFA